MNKEIQTEQCYDVRTEQKKLTITLDDALFLEQHSQDILNKCKTIIAEKIAKNIYEKIESDIIKKIDPKVIANIIMFKMADECKKELQPNESKKQLCKKRCPSWIGGNEYVGTYICAAENTDVKCRFI